MKLTDIETFIVGNPWKNWVLIQLHTDDGISGVGEATCHRRAKTAETAVLEMRRYFMGKDPFDVEGINAEMRVVSAPAYVTAAVDMACWDIMGKAAGVRAYQLLGGRVRELIKAYANGWVSGRSDV